MIEESFGYDKCSQLEIMHVINDCGKKCILKKHQEYSEL